MSPDCKSGEARPHVGSNPALPTRTSIKSAEILKGGRALQNKEGIVPRFHGRHGNAIGDYDYKRDS